MELKEDFIKFIKDAECSGKCFQNALAYLEMASFKEKELFFKRLDNIVIFCLRKINKNGGDLNLVKDMYERHGINEAYFMNFLSRYIKNNPDRKEVRDYLRLSKINDKTFLERIFWQCKNALWDKNKLLVIAKNNNLNILNLNQFLSYYAFHYLNFSVDDYYNYRNTYKSFRNLLNNSIKTTYDVKRAITYYQAFASLEEKNEFETYVKKLLVTISDKKDCKSDIDELLKSKNLTYYNLYTFLNTLPDIENEIKQNICLLFKDFYDMAKKANFRIKRIKKEQNNSKVDAYKILDLAKYYAINYLNIKDFELYMANLRNCIHYTSPKYAVLEDAINEEDIYKLAQIIDEYKIVTSDINAFCYCVHKDWDKRKQQRIEKKLILAFKKCLELRIDKLKVKEVDKAVYWEFVNSPLSIKDFCLNKGMSYEKFKQKIRDFIKKNIDEDLGKALNEKLNNEYLMNSQNKVAKCKELIDQIKKGIEINGIKREFTLFDYFLYFNGWNIHNIYNQVSYDRKAILSNFFKPLKHLIFLNKKDFINSTYEYNCQKDSNGFPIPGTGTILRCEELQNLVNIFTTNNIPFIDILVKIALKYYVCGCLIENNSLQRK